MRTLSLPEILTANGHTECRAEEKEEQCSCTERCSVVQKNSSQCDPEQYSDCFCGGFVDVVDSLNEFADNVPDDGQKYAVQVHDSVFSSQLVAYEGDLNPGQKEWNRLVDSLYDVQLNFQDGSGKLGLGYSALKNFIEDTPGRLATAKKLIMRGSHDEADHFLKLIQTDVLVVQQYYNDAHLDFTKVLGTATNWARTVLQHSTASRTQQEKKKPAWDEHFAVKGTKCLQDTRTNTGLVECQQQCFEHASTLCRHVTYWPDKTCTLHCDQNFKKSTFWASEAVVFSLRQTPDEYQMEVDASAMVLSGKKDLKERWSSVIDPLHTVKTMMSRYRRAIDSLVTAMDKFRATLTFAFGSSKQDLELFSIHLEEVYSAFRKMLKALKDLAS